MDEKAVVVRDLWEEFKVAADRTGTVKEFLTRFRISGGRRSFWALREVSFEVPRGQTVGLIGPNGSGKSTLLRCVAGILRPSKGEVLVAGSVASLIELGAGFHPDLTGRENAVVTAALFGLDRRRLQERMDVIVAFAELERVFDQPVRSYSSGMYVRLAFSLAVHAEPDILLVDELLAVGDESFQRKCIDRIRGLQSVGVTILFVSHNLANVEKVCDRCILLRSGELAADGEPAAVIDRYLELERLAPRHR